MKIGDINVQDAILSLEASQAMLDKMMGWILENNNLVMPDQQTMERFKSEVLKDLKNKYPANNPSTS